MSNQERLRDGLLRQDGIVPGYVPDRQLKAIQALAAKQKRSKRLMIRAAVGCYLASVLIFLGEIFLTHYYILSPDSSNHFGDGYYGYVSRSDEMIYLTLQYTAMALFISGMLISLIYYFRQWTSRSKLQKIETNLPDLAAKLGK